MLSTLNKNHLLQDVEYIASPNYDERPIGMNIDSIVLHCISLPPNNLDNSNTLFITKLFTNQLDNSLSNNIGPYFQYIKNLKVSSHLLISRDGKITQFVPFDKRAWHAGDSQYNDRNNFNDFSIGIELAGSDNTEFTEKQYLALVDVTSLLKTSYPILTENIVGHSDIAPNRKTDPGMYFNWQYFLNLIT